jgi:hypothetical protein
MAHSMVYPATPAERLAPWLQRSVTDYFATIAWEPLPPPLPTVTDPAAPPLTLSMSVVEYFANFPWGGSVPEAASKLAALPDLGALSALAHEPAFDALGLNESCFDAASSEQVSFEELFAASFDDVVEPDSGDPVAPSGPSLADFSDFF